ncbi:hypothetical protein AX16_010835 [Volvariella volvacea WC 439]|nr:hypothetical protein AX16_010835 [Volvariella volvacea WC 439]
MPASIVPVPQIPPNNTLEFWTSARRHRELVASNPNAKHLSPVLLTTQLATFILGITMEGESTGRTLDIELGGQEVITIDLEQLDPNPQDVIDVLKDGRCSSWIWTKLGGEYWRRGNLDAAEKIGLAAVDTLSANGMHSSIASIYLFLANIQQAYSRQAPKMVLKEARRDVLVGEKLKEVYYREAAQYLNTSQRASAEAGEGAGGTLAFLTRGIQQLETRAMDDAIRSFDAVLAEKPTNLVALLGKARVLYARKNYREALRLFQEVLKYNPNCQPDPRIGIGLCFWALDNKVKAKAAWQRSLELNPREWSAQLLLGLEAINASKNEAWSEKERASSYLTGTKLVEKAFKTNHKSAAAANALCELFLRKGKYEQALKLAERTVQFADTLTILTEGYIRAGRVLHAEGSTLQASKFFTAALEGQPKNTLAAIGLSQIHLRNEEMAAAIHTLDSLLQAPNPVKSLDATVMLASLRAYPRPGVSSSDIAQDKTRARELYDRALKMMEIDELRPQNQGHSRISRNILDDLEMHAEISKLWHGESLDRVAKALREALRISQASGNADPRLLNNLGALQQLDGHFKEAQALYEDALTTASAQGAQIGEGMSTSILYNLSRVYEEQGQEALAKDAYEKLVSKHPEYVDAKIRQAHMLSSAGKHNEAHDLLKQCLSSQPSNLNLRAYYIYFLIQNNLSKPAKDFVFATLKEYEKYDVYSLCAAGWIMYYQSRESRDSSPKAIEERKRGFQRAAEFYERALQFDPQCAFAAQGLAIVTAEDALGTLGGALGPPAPDEMLKRLKGAREALDVFSKVRESLNDGSVYVNMGHCYYFCDEYDRAIESYETASTRFYSGHNVTVLMYLCRSWYTKATKDQSYTAMNTALRYAQQALHLHPNDKAVVYNIAMIEQKTMELMFGIKPIKRTLKDLQRAIEQGNHAQVLFASLAADPSSMVPYSKDIADQRRKYGESLLRKSEEQLSSQLAHEAETQARMDAARKKRQEEKERLEAQERARMEELKRAAEKLAEERRIAREQALEWTREVKMESDEEKERKAKKASRRTKAENGSGDEANGEAGGGQKKKRRGKLRKMAGGEPDEDEPMFSDAEEEEKPKKRTKKRVVRDDDEDEPSNPRKKQYKSKEVLSDTDDEMS